MPCSEVYRQMALCIAAHSGTSPPKNAENYLTPRAAKRGKLLFPSASRLPGERARLPTRGEYAPWAAITRPSLASRIGTSQAHSRPPSGILSSTVCRTASARAARMTRFFLLMPAGRLRGCSRGNRSSARRLHQSAIWDKCIKIHC